MLNVREYICTTLYLIRLTAVHTLVNQMQSHDVTLIRLITVPNLSTGADAELNGGGGPLREACGRMAYIHYNHSGTIFAQEWHSNLSSKIDVFCNKYRFLMFEV